MEKDYLILKRASVSRPSGQWDDEDYDVLADGEVVGRIFKAGVSTRTIAICAVRVCAPPPAISRVLRIIRPTAAKSGLVSLRDRPEYGRKSVKRILPHQRHT